MHKLFAMLLIISGMLGVSTVLVPSVATAATAAECTGNASIPILPKWYKYIPHHFDASTNSCVVDAQFPESIPAILLAISEILLRIAGILAVIFVIYGGFQYLTSTGEPDKAKAGRTTIINALVGLMIAMLSTVIVNLVGRNIG